MMFFKYSLNYTHIRESQTQQLKITFVSGVMSVLYSALVTMLPEMSGVVLPETIEDVEHLGR